MSKTTLTDMSIRALSPPDKGQRVYWDKAMPGFGVRVSQGGTRTFILMHGEDRQRISIGRYPTISLKEARGEAKRIAAEFVLGRQRPVQISFADALKEFLSEKAQKNKPRTVADYRRDLNRHFPFGKKRLAEITRREVVQRINRLIETPAEQNHAFVSARTFFNWAVRNELLERSPIANMQMPAPLASRDRVLSDREFAEVYRKAIEWSFPYGPILELLILTGQRRSEISNLKWDWINREDRLIVLPPEITKNGRRHTLPYGSRVGALLDGHIITSETSEYLFPSRNEAGTVFKGWSGAKRRFDAILDDVDPFVLHDLRRTFSSTMAKLGTPIHVTEKLLNHVSGTLSGVAAIYNRHTYLPEMRDAIAAYDDHLESLLQS